MCLDQQSRHIGIDLQGSPNKQRYKHTIIIRRRRRKVINIKKERAEVNT